MARKAAKDLTRIFRRTNWIRFRGTIRAGAQPDGFTLIEVLVVIAIIALMAGFVMPGIASIFKVSINTAARKFSNVIRDSYNAAVLTGQVYRLVYDLDKNEYWAESGPVGALLDTEESLKKEERRKRFSNKDKKENKAPGYTMDKAVTRKKQELPVGVTFEDVLTEQSTDPIASGQTSTYFFPHGQTQQTIIHLKDTSGHRSSLVIQSISGITDVYDRYIKREEVFERK